MSNDTMVKLTVDKLTQYGIQSGNDRYSYSKYCKKDVALKVGDVIEAVLYVGAKGGKYLNEYNVVADSAAQRTAPALPPTSVPETKAPGGVVPVAPARKAVEKAATSETMTKADWANKDVAIERVAILKSVLESGAFAQLSVGKREEDVFAIGGRMVDFFLNKLNSLK